MDEILNTALDSVLVFMAQNTALQGELSDIFGKPFFPFNFNTKRGKNVVPKLLKTGKRTWR